MIRGVAIDLDGTLIDTAPDLGACVNSMLNMIGYQPLPESVVPQLIGAGITALVDRALEMRAGDSQLTPALRAGAEAVFRKLYRHHLFERSVVYPGVRHTLQALRSGGTLLCCITNKESTFAHQLLEAAELTHYFHHVFCGDLVEDRKPSPNLLLAACRRGGIEPQELVYVGDSRTDIVAARAAGCRAVAVTYGYHDARSLEEMHPDELIDNLAEIAAFVSGSEDVRGAQYPAAYPE
jgi:phosphoglycolate phosphatase